MQDRAKPYILTIPRRSSINSPKIVKDELDRMMSQGVQPKDKYAGMAVARYICVLRYLCGLNTIVCVERDTFYRALAQLAGEKVLSKLRCQFRISESIPLTTFRTPFGRLSCN